MQNEFLNGYITLVKNNPDFEDILIDLSINNVPYKIAEQLITMDFTIEKKEYGYIRDAIDNDLSKLLSICQLIISFTKIDNYEITPEIFYEMLLEYKENNFVDQNNLSDNDKKTIQYLANKILEFDEEDIIDVFENNYMDIENIKDRYGIVNNNSNSVIIGGGAGECLTEESLSFVYATKSLLNFNLSLIYGKETINKLFKNYEDFCEIFKELYSEVNSSEKLFFTSK
jgi:hypothetical protein